MRYYIQIFANLNDAIFDKLCDKQLGVYTFKESVSSPSWILLL